MSACLPSTCPVPPSPARSSLSLSLTLSISSHPPNPSRSRLGTRMPKREPSDTCMHTCVVVVGNRPIAPGRTALETRWVRSSLGAVVFFSQAQRDLYRELGPCSFFKAMLSTQTTVVRSCVHIYVRKNCDGCIQSSLVHPCPRSHVYAATSTGDQSK